VKIQKFEAFKPSDIKSQDVYLKNYMNGEKPERVVKDMGLNDTQITDLDEIREDIKKISWKDLKVKKSGSSFSNFTIYFQLPEHIVDKLKKIGNDFYKNEVLNKKMQIGVEASNHNRTHIEAIPSFMRGLGLGFKMYKAVVKRLGYITTFGDATPSAKKMWSNLIQDPSFYVLLTDNGALLIDKRYDKYRSEELIINYIKDYYGINIYGKIDKNVRDKFHMDNNPIKVDPEMAKAFNNLKLNRLDIDVFRRYDKMKDGVDYENFDS